MKKKKAKNENKLLKEKDIIDKRIDLLRSNNPDIYESNVYEAKILDHEIKNDKVQNIAIVPFAENRGIRTPDRQAASPAAQSPPRLR